MTEGFAIIEHRYMAALGDHGCDLIFLRRCKVGEIWVPFREQLPRATSLFRVRHLPRLAPCVDCLDFAQRSWLMPDRYGDPVVIRDIRELLARAIDQEIKQPAFVRIADDGRLGPAVRPYGRNAH